MIRVLIFNEFYHERHNEKIKSVYPDGIHAALASFLGAEEDLTVQTFTQEENGSHDALNEEVLNETDVLLW